MVKTLVIRWKGPLAFAEACAERSAGLYMVTGRRALGRAPSEAAIQYVGISEHAVGGRVYAHADREFNHANNSWWTGAIVGTSRVHRADLEVAEWMLTYFHDVVHAKKKTGSPPPKTTYVISEWTRPDGTHWARPRGGAVLVHDVLAWSPETRLLQYASRLKQHLVDR
jgi:hypothetical protein